MGKVSALYLVSQSLLGQALAPTLVVIVAQHFFSGPTALGSGLALCGSVFSILGLIALTVAYLGLRLHERSATNYGATV